MRFSGVLVDYTPLVYWFQESRIFPAALWLDWSYNFENPQSFFLEVEAMDKANKQTANNASKRSNLIYFKGVVFNVNIRQLSMNAEKCTRTVFEKDFLIQFRRLWKSK